MKNILNIKQTKNSVHIVWEHAMKSSLAFSGTYAVLFFGPLFLGGSSSHANREENYERSLSFMGYLLEHPEIQISICLLVVVIYNTMIVIKNTRKIYLVHLDMDENHVKMGLTNLFYKEVHEIQTPLKTLEYSLDVESTETRKKTKSIVFFDNESGKEIAIIKPNYVLWVDQRNDIKRALGELSKLGVQKTTANKTRRSWTSMFFRK